MIAHWCTLVHIEEAGLKEHSFELEPNVMLTVTLSTDDEGLSFTMTSQTDVK